MTDQRPGRGDRLWDRLSRAPRLPVFLGTLALGLVALFTPGIPGAVLVGLIAALLAAHIVATWGQRTPTVHAVRLLLLGMLVLIAASKLG